MKTEELLMKDGEFENATLETSLTDIASLRISVLYEDIDAGLRAKRRLDRYLHDLNMETDFFNVRLWSFNFLSDPGAKSQAAQQAKDSEIIILSAHGCGEPPLLVKEWMREWLGYREKQPCALVVLFDGQEKQSDEKSPLLDYAAGVAKAGQLDLVYPAYESETVLMTDSAIRKIARTAINASPVLEGILDHWESYPHWGINE